MAFQGASGTPRSQASSPGNGLAVVSSDENQASLPEIRHSNSVIDKSKPLPTSLQSDFLPEDVLLALTQHAPPSEKLGPASRFRNLNISEAQSRKPPASVWNFPKRREKLSHLTKNTPCVCGAGRDVSFLYDVPKKDEKHVKPDKFDPSVVRMEEQQEKKKGLALPDTLIPDEYHIVKNKGVMGLEYHEDTFGSQPVDHEAHLVLFPSMNPNSRYEVKKLKKALIDMLDKVGLEDLDSDMKGPTQMHNLLELIKKEQNIYNMVFHELIRQVSIECLDRGELLSELRDRYSDLFSRVPRQIKGLHEEVLAQRALDRRLTEELMRFKSTISVLTSELTDVKEHDQEVTKQANKAKEDLKSALAESHKNASLLAEYHSLYELQRKRLEKQVAMLSEEKEIWSTAAYSLALKVMEEHSLNSSKRLHVSEKAWAKLATHFTILLSDKDTELLTRLQGHMDQWRVLTEEFNTGLCDREQTMKVELNNIKVGLQKWRRDFEKNLLSKDGHLLKQPDKERLSSLYQDLKTWEDSLGHESEKFGGDILLSGQEALQDISKQVDGWTDCALKVFNRHRADNGENQPDHDDMLKMNEEITILLKQYHIRITGENGVATSLIHLSNAFGTWDTKVNALMWGANPLPDQDWLRFYQTLDDWQSYLDEALGAIGSTQKEGNKPESDNVVNVSKVLRTTQKWLSSTINGIDSEDAKIVEQVTTLHTEMVKWMVQMLLRLAPDKKEHSAEAKQAVLLASTNVGELQSNAKSLFGRLVNFTHHVSLCCNGIVMASMQQKIDNREDGADHEFQELQRLKSECDDWVRTATMMICELTGEEYKDTPPNSLTLLAPPPPAASLESTTVQQPDKAPDAEGPESVDSARKPEVKGECQAMTEESEEGEEAESVTKAEKLDSSTQDAEVLSPGQTKDSGPTTESVTADTEQPAEKVVEENPQEPSSVESSEQALDQTSEKPVEKLEVLGIDANTHTQSLNQDPDREPQGLKNRPPVTADTGTKTPDTKKAFEALATVDSLQEELIATEERAQALEERTATLEENLKAEQEKVRELERKIAQMKREEEESQELPTGQPEEVSKEETKKSAAKEEKPPTKTTSKSSSKASTKSKKK